jgi:hypothetical protein
MPGWFRNKFFIVNANIDVLGHRFCEKAVSLFDESTNYFISYCDRVEVESEPTPCFKSLQGLVSFSYFPSIVPPAYTFIC